MSEHLEEKDLPIPGIQHPGAETVNGEDQINYENVVHGYQTTRNREVMNDKHVYKEDKMMIPQDEMTIVPGDRYLKNTKTGYSKNSPDLGCAPG